MSERIPLLFRIIPFLIACTGIIMYIPGLTGEFLWDDVTYFVYNDYITELSPLNLKFIFTQPTNYWGEMLPLRDFLYIVQYQLFGDWTVGYHLFSLFLFICSGFVLFQWIKEITQDYFVADAEEKQKSTLPIIYGSIVMSLFFFNPLNVENVAYISGQKDVLSALFILLSLLFLYRVGKTTTNKKWFFLAIGILFHYLAIISKLSALSTILFIPILWLITGSRKLKETFKLMGIWILANVPVVFWTIYTETKGAPSATSQVSSDFSNRILRAFNVIGTHLEHIVWPWNSNYGYPFNDQWEFNFSFVLGGAIVLLAIVLIIKKWKSATCLGLFIFGFYLLPVLHVVQEIPNAKIYDRYLLIPVIGLFIILIGILNEFTKTWRKKKSIVLGGLLLLLSFWAIVLIRYVPTWKTMVASTEHAYKLYPEWSSTSFNLAISLIADKQLDAAEKMATNEKLFANWVSDYLMGRILQDKGEIERAYNLFYSVSVFTHQRGMFFFADSHIAQILIEKGDYHSASRVIEDILNNPEKDPIITYQVKQMAKEIERIQSVKE